MVNSIEKNKAAGSAATPSFQRHSDAPKWRKNDHVIRKIGEQNSEYDVELKKTDQASAQSSGSDLGNVHGAENGRSADAKASDETEDDERIPTPGKGATQRRDEVKNRETAQTIAPAKPFTRDAREHRPDHGSPDRAGNSDAEELWSESVSLRESAGGTGDHGRVEAE